MSSDIFRSRNTRYELSLGFEVTFANQELQYGVELDVPAATILSTFGLRAQVRDPSKLLAEAVVYMTD